MDGISAAPADTLTPPPAALAAYAAALGVQPLPHEAIGLFAPASTPRGDPAAHGALDGRCRAPSRRRGTHPRPRRRAKHQHAGPIRGEDACREPEAGRRRPRFGAAR